MKEKVEIHQIINVFSDPVLIVQKEKVVLANQAAIELMPLVLGMPLEELLIESAANNVKNLMRGIPENHPQVCPIKTSKNELKWFEIVSSKMLYQNEPAVISHAKDVTEKHHLLTQTHLFKKWFMVRKMPKWKGALVKTIFQNHHKGFLLFSEDTSGDSWGFIGQIDQTDLGSIMILSALDVFFREMLEIQGTLHERLQWLNEKTHVYFSSTSFKAILMRFNPNQKKIQGINMGGLPLYTVDPAHQFHAVTGNIERLGEKFNVTFQLFEIDTRDHRYLVAASSGVAGEPPKIKPLNIYEFSNTVCHSSRKDPTTYLCIDLDYRGDVYQYVLMGLQSFEDKIDNMLADISQGENFAVRLVLTELITNAYKHGNDRDMDLPIYIQIATQHNELFIEVKDLSIKAKTFTIIENISDEEIMSEGGRGLFLVKQFAQKVYLDENAVIVEMNLGEV